MATQLHFDPNQRRFAVRAVYFSGVIDLKAFRASHPQWPAYAADPLVVELLHGQYGVLTKFGAAVLVNCEEAAGRELTDAVAKLGLQRDDRVGDTLTVRVADADQDVAADFDGVSVREFGLDKLKMVALSLGQSVALEHFEAEIDRALREVQPRVDALRVDGKLQGAEKFVLRDIGFVLAVRAQVLAHLTLFDKPPDAWESAAIDRLDSVLYDHFDLDERMSAVNQKVEFLNDLNSTFLEALNHRKSVRLELIVVGLIVFEVLMGLWELFGQGHGR